MAASGSFKKTFGSGFTLLVEWVESGVDTANNQSDLTVTVKLSAASGYSINSSASKDISLAINGITYTDTCTVGISSGGSKTLMTETVKDITHGSEGSKNVSISCILEIAVTLDGSYISSVTASGSAELTKIARKSTLTVADGTLGTAQTLKITEQASSFKHKLKYECGSVSGWILGSSSTYSTLLSTSWTPPLSLASQNTTKTTVSIKFTLYTYTNADALVGSNSYTKSFTIPTSIKPTVSLAVSDSMGYLDTYGKYVQNKSKFQIEITAEGSYGSTIKTYKTVVDGKTYTSDSFETSVISGTGNLEIAVTVTDSRGRTGTNKITVQVLAYSPPKTTAMTVKRCDEDGTANTYGEYLAVVFNAEITPLENKNSATYEIEYTSVKESITTQEEMTDFSGLYVVTEGTFIFPAETTSSYNITIRAIDDFGSIPKSTPGSSILSLITYCKEKLRVALCKVAEIDNLFDVDIPTRFRKSVTFDEDVIVKGNGVYTAFESTDYPGCYYRTVDDVVEWINPPMEVGVEYRTTERYQGKPVYRKLVSYTNTATIGSGDSVATVEIPHGVSGLSSLVRIGARVSTYRLPYISQSGGFTDACAVNTTNITLRMVNTSWTSRDWIFDLAYIK